MISRRLCWPQPDCRRNPLGPQAAKTYLEKHLDTFPTASLDDLIRHGLRSLQVGQVRVVGHTGLGAEAWI